MTATTATAPADPPRFPSLDGARVPGLPPAAFYKPDFITPDEEELLLRKLADTPMPKWKTAGTGRRLQYWGGTLAKDVLVPEPMPEFLTGFPHIVERIDKFLDDAAASAPSTSSSSSSTTHPHVLGINQVLINEYAPGQGIAPHEDGGAFSPLVATLSLGAHTVLDLYHYVSPTAPSPPMVATEEEDGSGARAVAAVPLGHVLLLPRSLFVLSASLYADHLHGIAARDEDVCVGPGVEVATATGDGDEPAAASSPPVVVANASLLAEPDIQAALATPAGWTSKRGTRTSLTFRHATRVLKGGAFSMVGGRMRRS